MLEKDIKEFVKKLDFTHGKYDNKNIFRDLISLEVFMIQAKVSRFTEKIYKRRTKTIAGIKHRISRIIY